MEIKKGGEVKLKISDYAFEGKGIAKIDLEGGEQNKFVIFVDGAFPGDLVEAVIIKKKKNYAEAKANKLLVPSPVRTEPRCRHFGICGGCKQQNMLYQSQLDYKAGQVKDIFERIAGLKNFSAEPVLASNKIFFYRNKMEFSFSDRKWLTKEELLNQPAINEHLALGLHIPKIYDKVLDIEECFLQSEESNKIINLTRDFFKAKRTTVYSIKTHSGFLRNLVIKQSQNLPELMVNLVTSAEDDELIKELAGEIINNVPEVTTIVNNINLKKSQVAVGDYEKIYYGSGYIHDTIGGYKFRISANSFFQTNSLQAENLYQTAVDFAGFNGSEIVYDLYAGAGTISIFISKFTKEVYAFESVDSAVSDAWTNNELNSISNVRYFLTDLNRSFLQLLKSENIAPPDIIICDPPRSGMNPRTVKDIITINPQKIVYISCNPSTQARDIKILSENGFSLIKIKPVDMFPHTYHIENIALLVRN